MSDTDSVVVVVRESGKEIECMVKVVKSIDEAGRQFWKCWDGRAGGIGWTVKDAAAAWARKTERELVAVGGLEA